MFVSVALLSTFSYRAVREWQRSATLLAESRAQQGADLLAAALTRDMRAAQLSLLSSPDWYDAASFSEVSHLIAGAFARLDTSKGQPEGPDTVHTFLLPTGSAFIVG